VTALLRRGACPGLSAPMQTGDGLLVRMLPIGTIPLQAFAGLCAAAREHGNGIVEITARGSIQVRGLDAGSAPRFAAAVAALGIAAQEGVPVLTNPLAGLDPDEVFGSSALAADLRLALAGTDLAARLSPKVSVVVDGGGSPGIEGISADVRLRAEPLNGHVALRISVGTSAKSLGDVAPTHAVGAILRALDVIARRGRDARARDIVAAEGDALFRAALENSAPAAVDFRLRGSERKSPIGAHRLHEPSFAYGVGLAFGHADATLLEELTQAAKAAGADGMRAAPDRVLMVIGLTQETIDTFAADAERLGFITHAGDSRRRVIACAGAPICASAYIAARALAPHLAAALPDRTSTIHISGCAKGCASSAPATLTVVGRADGCALIANGSTRDVPFAVAATDQLPAAIASALREGSHV